MNKNVGTVDKALRIIVGLAIIVYGVVAGSWLGVIGVVPLATAIIGWCPLYCPLNIKTCGDNCSN